MNRYLVKFTKKVIVIEARVVDAFTIQDAKDIILADDQAGEFVDQYVVQDLDVEEIQTVEHLRMVA